MLCISAPVVMDDVLAFFAEEASLGLDHSTSHPSKGFNPLHDRRPRFTDP